MAALTVENGPNQENQEQKVSKVMRYYYKHREEILEKRRQKKLNDPEYQAKQKAKEEEKRQREEEREEKRKEEKKRKAQERARARAEHLGIQLVSSGVIYNHNE